MKNLQEELNRATDGKYNFKYKNGLLDSKTGILSAEIVYDDGTILSSEDKELCKAVASKLLPEYTINLTFTKNFVSKGTIKRFLKTFINSNYVSLKYNIKSIEEQDAIYIVVLQIAEEQKAYIQSQKILSVLTAALKERFMQDFMVNSEYLSNMLDFSKIEEEKDVISEQKKINVTNKEVLIGAEIKGNASYIRDSRNPEQTITICGYIRELKVLWTKPKAKEGQNQKDLIEYFKHDVPISERKEAGQKAYYRFKIQDFTGDMQVMAYPKDVDQEKAESLKDGMTIVASGIVKDDNYFGMYLRADNVSVCSLPEIWEEEIDYKKEKSFYEFVKPVDMVYTDQVGLFSMFDAPQVAPYLKNNQIVVFDFETTGLNAYEGDKIVEIGAVKVINGAIVQSFRTLVNPEMHIPESSSAVHKIFDKDVVDAPKAEQALQDFYKFTRGCVLVGYNVSFDYSFLMTQGKACRYNFDNTTFDCLELARKCIKGIKNYRLGTIAKELGVNLENAHSALADTIATAEVFIKLADKI